MTESRRESGPLERQSGLRLDDREEIADVNGLVEFLLLVGRQRPLPGPLRELIDAPLFGAAETKLQEGTGRLGREAAGIQFGESFQHRRADPPRFRRASLGRHDFPIHRGVNMRLVPIIASSRKAGQPRRRPRGSDRSDIPGQRRRTRVHEGPSVRPAGSNPDRSSEVIR